MNGVELGKKLKQEMEKGVERWIVDISEWKPSPSRLSSLISLLPQHHHSSVTRFVKMEDQKRALVSRLLQYGVVHHVLGIPFHDIFITSTLQGKPYVHFDKLRPEFPNFNFSVSHHGDFVAIASEPFCLVGLDIVSHASPSKETARQYINSFSSYFSSTEWDNILNAGSCDDMLQTLYRYWSLKEAFIKAIGSGLGFRLDALEFDLSNWNNFSAKFQGEEVKHWKFWHLELKKRHYVSIVRGPPRMATESFKQTLGEVDYDEVEYDSRFNLPNTAFKWKTVEQLIPN